ncbi:sensor histidine kinase [Paenibacillus athensensis]|nr:sensor histidine kinase [Paenibacillus athensensis]MCD1257248.1 sensor histidine kinase [Paenibacillus athensensis]
MIKMSIFRKMIYVLCLLIFPIVGMYAYSVQTNTAVIEEHIHLTNINRLTYFANEIDSQIKQITLSGLTLTEDPNVQQFMGYSFSNDSYENARNKAAIIQKLKLLAFSVNWPVNISIFSNVAHEVISNDPSRLYDEGVLRNNVRSVWISGPAIGAGSGMDFHWYAYLPENKEPYAMANLVVELRFTEQPLVQLLDHFKQQSVDEPVLYRYGGDMIANRSLSPELKQQFTAWMGENSPLLEGSGTFTAELGGQSYEIAYVRIPSIQWYALNITPVEKILKPIHQSRNLFLLFIGFITLLSFAAAFMLYRQVQIPLDRLIRGLKKIQSGDYAVRLATKKRDEFHFLNQRFNDMAERIQELIERVFHEKLHAREATLKHLQSQINPHFIYNCMGFIINMSKLKHQDAVISMAQNLSQYYRYTTRLEKPTASLKEELKLVTHYLEIQKLRQERVHYEIDVPEEMLDIQLPRLMLQPIVENAIIHGVQSKLEAGFIRICGRLEDDEVMLYVEDDGKGLDEEQRSELENKMKLPLQEEIGCGLWNVHQRLKLHFGEQAEAAIGPSELGGLRVTLLWSWSADEA